MSDTFSSSSSSSSPSPSLSAKNRGTMIAPNPVARPSWDLLAAAHARACQAMSGQRATAPGFRLYWVRRTGIGWTDLASPGAYAIVGRHSRCDGVLDDEPILPLRHLLATTVSLADGLALRLLDLQTGLPFSLGDETARRSLVASGPVAVSVGEQVVGAVPIEETATGLQLRLDGLFRPKVTDARTSQPDGPYRSPATRDMYSAKRITLVTSMPAARSFADLAPAASAASASQLADASREGRDHDGHWSRGAVACIVVRRGKLMAAVDLSEEQLEHGVILGRADRCLDQGLMAVLDNSISRAHVLLMRHPQEPGILEVFDLCSTNGTYVDKQRVRRICVEDDGATFRLGGTSDATVSVKVRFPPSPSPPRG